MILFETYVGVSYKYPLAADLTGNRASFPGSAATVLDQRLRLTAGYSPEGTFYQVFLSQIPALILAQILRDQR